MIIKELAKQTFVRLPIDSSYDDIIHALYINAKFEKGLQEIKDGKGIEHREAKERLQKWA